ncbi:hypothetical protein [Pseudomonas sp. 3MA1]|uniref:hypothetical protein n=1 Tax=Pseudomonas sp. 3MA1 TaxID=2699196 RepID=UPI0023DE0C0A|nr:hypothetical protein [Pseudomonas sp. 3MA1]
MLMEDWLSAETFGPAGADVQYLRDPQEAFYRLLGVFAGISIVVGRNPLFEPNAKLDSRAEVPHSVRSADTLIRIESRLPGLLGSMGTLDIQAECRPYQRVTKMTIQGSPHSYDKEPVMGSSPKAQRLYNDALELYFSTPPNTVTSHYETRKWQWAVRAQIVLNGSGETHYFPAPKVKDSTLYEPTYAKPDFNKINRSFWADEQTHKETSNE